LREKLEAANEYASQHSKAEQSRFVNNYNRRTRDKAFSVGEQCLILQKDSSSSALFAQWKGPAEIMQLNRHIHILLRTMAVNITYMQTNCVNFM
jgi:hypothetical protein